MDDSFEVRVKRLFGSKLFESVPSSSFPAASWSVAGGEVERREWNRERGDQPEREDNPCSSAFYDEDGCLSKKRKSKRDRKKEFEGDFDDLDDDDDDDEGERGGGEEGEYGDDAEREERDIRSSAGLDPTLDNEDEEDEYDKAALCRESSDERLYMRDVKDHSPYLNYHSIAPDFLEEPSDETHHLHRDPRAVHFAASVRLEEDKTAGESCPPLPNRNDEEPARGVPVKIAEDDVSLKPILKRKEALIDPKPKKRVRFDPGCKDEPDEVYEEPQDFPMVPQSMETNEVSEVHSSLPEESPGVPDYIRNPSKYTHYTFDSTEDGDETNKRAFEEFHNLVKRSNPDQLLPEFSVELPKSVTFTLRKKSGDAVPMDDNLGYVDDSCKASGQVSAGSMGIAAGEADESYACEMEEDDAEAPLVETSISSQKDRQYRSRSASGDSS